MNATIVVAVVSAGGAIAVAALTYLLNKRREREVEWRKVKLEHYKEYVAALSGIVGAGPSHDAVQARYSSAVNALVLIAPPPVLKSLYAFQDEIRFGNADKSMEGHDETLSALLREIRRDVHPATPDDDGIVFRLFRTN